MEYREQRITPTLIAISFSLDAETLLHRRVASDNRARARVRARWLNVAMAGRSTCYYVIAYVIQAPARRTGVNS